MRIKFITLLIVIFGSSLNCSAQKSDSTINSLNSKRKGGYSETHLAILTGYNFWENHYIELGLAWNERGQIGHHPHSSAYFVSTEYRLGSDPILGPKIGIWIDGGATGIALGLNLICYTDFDETSFRFRPEIGTGFNGWKLVYGYNFALSNKSFESINTHNITLAAAFSVKKIKTTRY